MDDTLGNERAPLQDDQECDYGPYYRCSSSLQNLNVIPSTTITSILVKNVGIKSTPNVAKKKDILLMMNFIHPYLGFLQQEEIGGLMEWTKRVLVRFEEPLQQAGICGAIGVSQFPYHFETNVWRTFYELWSPLTNALHHGAGEVVYPFLELHTMNSYLQMAYHNKYPTTVVKLLRIHAELCKFHKVGHIYYDLWLGHFYRECLVHFAYGEQTDSERGKVEPKKRSPFRISR
ncbi:hypothetical protein Cgig2_012067 [Carnegiea gigantea]|uniref:Uncharacterized protein n=1 Tax=Carnegiea gigantea TaxID=171969 RepID=A0A9Q1KSN2_9CARY|nr:hypothetical protein Cgig2_012067 [Carnegiea gigantea]